MSRAERCKNNRAKLRLRQQINEPVFGTIKHAFGIRQVLHRGLEKVGAEFSLVALVFNLKRAINILGVKELVALMA